MGAGLAQPHVRNVSSALPAPKANREFRRRAVLASPSLPLQHRQALRASRRSAGAFGMSALCQKQTHALQQTTSAYDHLDCDRERVWPAPYVAYPTLPLHQVVVRHQHC
jgi:hypothetical protein